MPRRLARLMPRRRSRPTVLFLLLGLSLTLPPLGPVSADHGAWHHNNHVWDPSPSSYSGYAHTHGTNNIDFGYARFIAWRNGAVVVSRSVSCGPVEEGCSEQRTTTGSWAQGGSHTVQSQHCGRDDPHQITSGGPTTCRIIGNTGVHAHQSGWND